MKWFKVLGYQCEVTKFGNVRDNTTKVIRKQYIDKDKYKLVSIKSDKDNEWKIKGVHQLVALTFIGPRPSKKHQINHKDLDKANNYYKNLEWCTFKENIRHRIINGIILNQKGASNGNAKLTKKQVTKIRKLSVIGNYTQKELGNKFNVSKETIGSIVNYRTWN